MYFQRRPLPSIPREIVKSRRPNVSIEKPNIPNQSLKQTTQIVQEPNIPDLNLDESLDDLLIDVDTHFKNKI